MTTVLASTKLTNWQVKVLRAIAASEVSVIYPVASKAYVDWYRPDAKPRHRRPTTTVQQLTDAGLAKVAKGGAVACTRKGTAALRSISR